MEDSGRRINRVYRVMNKPMTLMGVDRRIFFSVVCTAAATFTATDSLLAGLMLFVTLWQGAKLATARDPQLLRAVMNSSRFRREYCPIKRDDPPVIWIEPHA